MLIGLGVLASVSRPVDGVSLGVNSHDSTVGSDGNVSGSSESVVRHLDPLSDLAEFGFVEATVLGDSNHGSVHTDRDVSTVGDTVEGVPSSTVDVVHDVHLSVLTADNGLSGKRDGDAGSSGGTLTSPFVVDSVVDLSVSSSDPDVTLGTNTDINDVVEDVSVNVSPFLGVELVELTVSGDSPRHAISTSSNSDGLDVVTELLPVVEVHATVSSPSVLVDLTVLASNENLVSAVGGDIDSLDSASLFEVDFAVVLALVLHVRGTSGDGVNDLVRSADEGSLLFAVHVVPSSVLLEGEAVSLSGGLVLGPVSEREVSVVVRPSPELVLLALDTVVMTTNPDFGSSLDSLVFLEGVVLVLSEDGGEVPSLLLTVSLGVPPVKSELGGEVPDSLVSRFTSLISP